MGKINRFEDIIAGQKARVIENEIFDLIEKGNFKRDYSLRDQILRACTSVMLNIAEGFGRRTNKEFIQLLVVSHGSVSEIQSALYTALDRRYIFLQ